MKRLALLLLLPLLPIPALPAAQLGPEVAVLEIQFGKTRGWWPFRQERDLEYVTIGLYDNAAPATTANFKELVTRGFYNNMRFHRAFADTLVQTGDPYSRRGPRELSGTGGPGHTLPAEIGLRHKAGAVAMARLPDRINPARQSNGSQFYICLQPMPDLNGQYTVFGEVLAGMEVLERISNSRVDSNDFPLEHIIIRRVTLQPRLPEAPQPAAGN